MDVAPAEELLAGIASRDYDRIAACFAPDATLRALTPRELHEERGRDVIAARYRRWLGELEPYELLSAGAEPVADRVRVRYRFRGRDPAKGWQENEHTAYGAIERAQLVALNLSCAGFRPAEPPG